MGKSEEELMGMVDFEKEYGDFIRANLMDLVPKVDKDAVQRLLKEMNKKAAEYREIREDNLRMSYP